HPVPFSYLDLRVEDGRPASPGSSGSPGSPGSIDAVLVVHVFDIAHDLNVDPPERLLAERVAAERASAIVALLQPRVQIAADGRPLTPAWSGPDVLADRQSLRFHLRYSLERAPGSIAVSALLFPYDPNHQTFLNVYEHGALTSQTVLDRGRT